MGLSVYLNEAMARQFPRAKGYKTERGALKKLADTLALRGTCAAYVVFRANDSRYLPVVVYHPSEIDVQPAALAWAGVCVTDDRSL